MNKRSWIWILLCLLLLACTWLFRPAAQHQGHSQKAAATAARPTVTTTRSASTAPLLFVSGNSATNGVAKTNEFAYRLTNTPKSLGQLMSDPHAILLENALLDTRVSLNLSIPKNLQAKGDPGAYIVQANGPINSAFRAALAAAGAQIVSYIPNNAYLVSVSAGGAAGLSGQSGVQSVNPYEPYYKISASLLGLAVNQKNLPDNSVLTLGLFPNNAAQTVDQIKQLGATVVATDQSPFGPIVRVTPPQNWTELAVLPGVQIVELAHRRAVANDLARVTLNISADTVTLTNYLGLSGSNVLVEVNDTGIDQTHPDFSLNENAKSGGAPAAPPGIAPGTGRVIGDSPLSLVDTNGHGTHVAGIIAGNGWESPSLDANEPQGSVSNADFRGKAPAARLYSVAALDNTGASDTPDYYLQTAPALTNALISNNSWTYVGDSTYDLAAASYDAAVRDALPTVTGSQPVLFVFSAGNDGGGGDDGAGGNPDTILSPGTAKDVITVGALEQLRNITNLVGDASGNTNPVWQVQTDSGNQVAGYSARGNVGIGTEGTFGRFKPDVVAPGSFVVSTRSSEWDQAAYYNPTNYIDNDYVQQVVEQNTLNYYSISVPANAVGVDIYIVPDFLSPVLFPTNLPIYVSQNAFPTETTYQYLTARNQFSVPSDSGAAFLSAVQNSGFSFAVGNTNNFPVYYDLITVITTTNGAGDYFTVLSNLNDSIGPWYRYESGTSMATPAVSGTLALIQDYFTNTLHTTPSPALLKAMLINGATSQGSYAYSVTNEINLQGWGLPNIQNSVPLGLTNQLNAPCSTLFLDQSPTNALATGDSQTFLVTLATNSFAQDLPLRVTVTWTDPPGNPVAGIKLVNNLVLVVTNLDTGDVYYGNNFDDGSGGSALEPHSVPWQTNTPPGLDTINNVENVYLSPFLGSSYSVTILGYSVNVNAVTAQSNNVVQDYALVIACGEGEVTNAITVTANPFVSNPTGDQDVTVVGVDANGMATNTDAVGGVFFNQLAGASTPLLGTNQVDAVSNYPSTAVVTLGMTNQWHFYVVQNNTTFSNAAFVTFSPDTLSMPRMGVYVDPTQNPTTPEADIDMYVSTDPSLTNLNPVVISNCVNGTQVGVSAGGAFNGSSLGGGGTEYVVDTGSVMGQVYYVGVKSETAIAGEYGFLPVFSQQPFSQQNPNGTETVNGLLLPTPIPDGSPAHPGLAFVFALAIQPMLVQDVIVSNQITHQNFGDLIGKMTHNGKGVILNNHDSVYNPSGIYNFTYDDGPQPVPGSQPPSGPGTLQVYQGQQCAGPWILTEVDDALTHTGAVTGLTLNITPHQDLNQGVNISVQAFGYFYGFIDVPVGTTNLTLSATNISGSVLDPNHYALNAPPFGILYEKLGEQPVPPPTPLTNYDQSVTLNNFGPFGPGGSIFVTLFDVPPVEPGRYYVTLYNPAAIAQQYFILATLGIGKVQPVDFTPTGPVPLLDDAVSYAYITNYPGVGATNETIASIAVGIRVDHPRISDLVFTLISPDGTRYLLMQNRGNTSTNGAGATIYTTNDIANYSNSGTTNASTNFVFVSQSSGTLPISWNFYQIPDEMTVYDNTNGNYGPANLLFDTGMTNGTGQVNLAFTTTSGLTIIINQFGNTNGVNGDAWTYTAGGVQTNFAYLTFTDDTNITTPPIPSPMIPIKFAPTPFVPGMISSIITNIVIVPTVITNFVTNSISTFATPTGNYLAGSTVDSWAVLTNQVSVAADPVTGLNGSNLLALANGVISNNLPTVPGNIYALSFAYRGPSAAAWYRGEGNANDSINGNNGTVSGGVTFPAGEVGQAFRFDGATGYIPIPASPSLNIGTGSGVTIECWINPSFWPAAAGLPLAEWDSPSKDGLQLWGITGNYLFANLNDTAGNFHTVASANGTLTANSLQYVALTYDKLSGLALLYINGVQAASANIGNITPQTSYPLNLGKRTAAVTGDGEVSNGLEDEVGLYNRALSASEIKAIYSNGSAGKFDPVEFANSPQLSLSEAGVSLPGVFQTNLFGNNTSWQTQTIGFTATQTNTPLVIQGVEPGMLLDAFVLTRTLLVTNSFVTNVFYTTNLTVAANALDYQPEQDLTPLIGTSAYGLWTLEIQDDRVGATNNTVLDSWQLSFVFADTNPAPFIPTLPVTIPGTEICNPVPATNILWYQVNVPLNAIFATNTLISSDQPVNLLINTNSPGITGATVLLTNQTSGVAILSTTNGTPLLIPGSTYYLGVQNTNGVTANTCIQVDFGLLVTAYAYTEPAQLVTGTSAQLNGFATPNGFQATAWFQWGTNTAYGNQTPQVNVGLGYNVVYTTSPILIVTNMPYHFRLVVSNVLGVVYGFDQILDEANVVAWGPNYAGQLDVPTNKSVTAIAGAYDHNLALTTNGQVLAWGDNTFGQVNVPAGLSNVVTLAVAGGQYYSMALLNGGTVTSWGANLLSQTNVPVGLGNVVIIAGGQYSSLALQNNGTVVAWGANFFNLTNVPASASNIVAVAGGGYHSLALKNDGTVTAWGDNSAGQTNVAAGLNNVVAIAAGGYHNLALKYDGTVVAWGDDSVGQTNVPVGLSNVVAIAAGGFHSVALKADGTLVTWGDNTAGQASVPVGLTNVVAISAGYLHSVALTPQMLINSTNPFVLPLFPGVPQTNNIFAGGITYYQVSVPTNADFATNTLLFANNGGLNIWFSTNTPPVPNATNATELGINVTNGVWVLNTNGGPGLLPPLVPGSTYYLGVQNPNNFTVNYAIQVDFHLTTPVIPPPFTNIITISSIIHTNINGTNGFLLTWFAPSNDLFQVQWSSGLPPVWNTFSNIVSFNPAFYTNGPVTQFNYFDNGSQAPFVGPTRFYRLVQLGSLLNLSNGVPQTANVAPDSTAYYSITVPANADAATNALLSATAPVNLLFNQNVLPTGTNSGGYTLLANSTGGLSILTGTTTPPLVPGATYYLGVQNTNSFTVQFTLQVNFHLPTGTTGYPISAIIHTNGGFLLVWSAPTNDTFQVQHTDGLSPINWQNFSNIITYSGPPTPTNGIFTFFDDGSQTGGLPPIRFYRLLLQNTTSPANTPPVLPPQTTQTINPLATLTVINTATDANLPPQTLTYALSSTVTGTNLPAITTNGIITWTPTTAQARTTNTFTTIVADSGVPPLSATNSFTVIVNPLPVISSVTVSNGNYLLTWLAPTNDIFTVQVATNLALPIIWQTVGTNVTYTGPLTPTNGWFSFIDNFSQVPASPIRFYRLILTDVIPPATGTGAISISSIVATNGNFVLTWSAPTKDQFQVAWATNLLLPINWTRFPGTNTSTTGVFSFTDTNAPLIMKFYELLLLP